MQFAEHIASLLYRYDCVVLPDFGAFLTQYTPAQHHETTNAFYPPKKQLAFNAQLVSNDGLLANYIAKVSEISYEEACEKIKSQVRQLFDHLHQGNKVVLDNIGVFFIGEEQALQFEPSYHLNYLTTAFGLSSFTKPEIKRLAYKEEVIQLEQEVPIAFTPERRNRKWMNYAAVGFIGFCLLGYGAFTYLNQVEKHNTVAQQEANEAVNSKIQEATFVIDNPLPAITLAFTKPKGNFHVIAGAFSFEANAKKKIGQLKDKGYDAYLMGKNAYGLFQVAYGSYVTNPEALKVVRQIRKTDNPAAWIDVRNLDN